MEIITTHKNVDFDAIASVFAAGYLYPQAVPVLPKSVNPNVRAFLSIHKDLFPYREPKEVDLSAVAKLIVVDTNRWSRLEGMGKLKGKPGLAIDLWDHHTNEGDIDCNWSCCEATGAAISLFVRRFMEDGISLTPIQATLFMAGIYEDTGNLTFPATTALDAKAVGFLLEQEADLTFTNNFLRPVYGPKQKGLLFEMLQSAERQEIRGHTVSINTVTIKGHTPGLALVVNMYQDIMNVTAAFGLFVNQERKQCMVIGRSAGEDLDVGMVMRMLGGGGHKNAGSAMVKEIEPRIIRGWIIDAIQGESPSSVQISDLMSFPVISISPDVPMRDAALRLRETGCTGLPVVENGKVVGILSRRDFKRMEKSKQTIDAPVKTFMSRQVVCISPQAPVGKAARMMVKNDIGRLPVLEGEALVGIVTRSDVMTYYYDLLPGEVPLHAVDESSFILDAALPAPGRMADK